MWGLWFGGRDDDGRGVDGDTGDGEVCQCNKNSLQPRMGPELDVSFLINP